MLSISTVEPWSQNKIILAEEEDKEEEEKEEREKDQWNRLQDILCKPCNYSHVIFDDYQKTKYLYKEKLDLFLSPQAKPAPNGHNSLMANRNGRKTL